MWKCPCPENPGFSRRGCANPLFCRKLHGNGRIWTKKGASLAPHPLDPPLAIIEAKIRLNQRLHIKTCRQTSQHSSRMHTTRLPTIWGAPPAQPCTPHPPAMHAQRHTHPQPCTLPCEQNDRQVQKHSFAGGNDRDS